MQLISHIQCMRRRAVTSLNVHVCANIHSHISSCTFPHMQTYQSTSHNIAHTEGKGGARDENHYLFLYYAPQQNIRIFIFQITL